MNISKPLHGVVFCLMGGFEIAGCCGLSSRTSKKESNIIPMGEGTFAFLSDFNVVQG